MTLVFALFTAILVWAALCQPVNFFPRDNYHFYFSRLSSLIKKKPVTPVIRANTPPVRNIK